VYEQEFKLFNQNRITPMPANLPPEYFAADKRFREAQSTRDKIEALEELISTIPKHKGTDKLRADLRRRLSKLKEEIQSRKHSGHHESVFHIEREGAGRVVIVGSVNVGKSALLAALTHALPKVSEVPFTTRIPMPGMMMVENVQVQLIDTPALCREHWEPEWFDLLRSADLLLLLADLQADPVRQINENIALLLEKNIPVHWPQKIPLNPLSSFSIPLLMAVNKDDDQKYDEDYQLFCELMEGEFTPLPISVRTGRQLEKLRQLIFKALNIVRVYAKPPGQEPDLTAPFVLKKGSTIIDLAGKVHKDFLHGLKSARIWGRDVHDGQQVGREHILQDGDIVELHIL
jgi:small GTP-binding protein